MCTVFTPERPSKNPPMSHSPWGYLWEFIVELNEEEGGVSYLTAYQLVFFSLICFFHCCTAAKILLQVHLVLRSIFKNE